MTGLILGGSMSVMSAPTAGAKAYFCDQKIEHMVSKAAQGLENGKISAEKFEELHEAIAAQKANWGC